MTKELAQKACDWIMEDRYPPKPDSPPPSLTHESAVPVRVSIGKQDVETWFGALYCVAETIRKGLRVATEGPMTEGEIERSYRLYLIGKRFKPSRDKWVAVYDLPADRRKPLERCYAPENEWYTACYWDGNDGAYKLTPEAVARSHPFGPTFILTLHHIMNFGYYKDQKIDHCEQKPYDRYPMTVEYL